MRLPADEYGQRIRESTRILDFDRVKLWDGNPIPDKVSEVCAVVLGGNSSREAAVSSIMKATSTSVTDFLDRRSLH